ncbi:GrpB family protein [Arthrobacter sp. EH-1B-1]|uniref:GrpB family protein n=1 Tax=Arthrobacter vasquezii TaxID=2977629 RepID=A0ABT6CUL8_9MICC|nr:GrpB family protein [Arthrobacter vasquezii]MDF9277766.1 GrpB family protein [Arthrobacter vasquezii]
MSAEEDWVEVVPHDDRWVLLYRNEAAEIHSALGGYALGIEHFGSTAVPGLVAKPIVDILAGVREGSDPRPAIDGLERLGYEYLGEDGRRPGRYFWRKRGMDAFNVSVVPHCGELWESNIAFRDFLRTHPDWAERYGQAKLSAGAASATSMLGYQDGKREFVDTLRTAAVAWAGEHGVNER